MVNGGNLIEPYLVSEVIRADGSTVLKQEPTVVRQTIRKETSEIMCRLLQSVVEEGTAKNAQVAGFSIGGKTGTSEKIDVFDENGQRVTDKIVSFVGIAPMEDPQYIVLVALDTPSRETGIYISGGVLAAPTVGAGLADILPYLGVEKQYGQEEQPSREIVMEDLTGMTRSDAQKQLKEQTLTACFVGNGETVTGQIPAAGKPVPGGSQILVYMGEETQEIRETVPDLPGMNRAQATDAAGKLGLYLLHTGNSGNTAGVVATSQNIPAGTEVAVGTTIQVEFTDTGARD